MIDIFYDGTNIEKYGSLPYISGFTTNTSFMAQGNCLNYTSFYEKHKNIISSRPLSLQAFDENDEHLMASSEKISNIGSNVYVKVPVIKTSGSSNLNVIVNLLKKDIKVNVTAVFTIQQCIDIYTYIRNAEVKTDCIVSIFAGRISDTGVNPYDIVKFACDLFKELPHVKILWAGCKEMASITNAMRAGCHIITIPDNILDRMDRKDKDLLQFSIETVRDFHDAAVKSNIVIG